jgi:hypothetical protein
MRGLYDGFEEVPFKPVAGGYVFQSNNPWLIGPRRRYFVNEVQKTEIAACIRETLRRIKPFAFGAAAVIPLVLIAAITWFMLSGATLVVTEVDAAGITTIHEQPIGKDGATGTQAYATGGHFTYAVSGPPGVDATVTIAGFDRAGKAGTSCVVKFDSGGTKIVMNDDNGHLVRTVTLTGRTGAPRDGVIWFGMLLGFALFVPYVALMHAYSMARLRPLLAGLPRSEERITLRDSTERFAAKISNKFLLVVGLSAVIGLVGNALTMIAAIYAHRPIDNVTNIAVSAGCALLVAYYGYLFFLKIRLRHSAS